MGPDFGALIAQCGPQKSGQNHYLVAGAVMLVFALLCVAAPNVLAVKPADVATLNWVFWIFGGFSALAGVGMIWHTLYGHNQTIFLYERGLIERVGAVSYAIALEEIEHLRLQEFYEHRFAPLTFNVLAKIRGERELAFSSALCGESNRIIAYLSERVTRTELVPFQTYL